MLQESLLKERRKTEKLRKKCVRQEQLIVKLNLLQKTPRKYQKQNSSFQSLTPTLTTPPFKIQGTSDTEEDATEESSTTGLSKAIWDSLTPRTKRKTKITLCESHIKGVKNVFRKEIGINLSNPFKKPLKKNSKKSDLCTKIEDFFEKDHKTVVCPDAKKMLSIPEKKNEKVPARFRLGNAVFPICC